MNAIKRVVGTQILITLVMNIWRLTLARSMHLLFTEIWLTYGQVSTILQTKWRYLAWFNAIRHSEMPRGFGRGARSHAVRTISRHPPPSPSSPPFIPPPRHPLPHNSRFQQAPAHQNPYDPLPRQPSSQGQYQHPPPMQQHPPQGQYLQHAPQGQYQQHPPQRQQEHPQSLSHPPPGGQHLTQGQCQPPHQVQCQQQQAQHHPTSTHHAPAPSTAPGAANHTTSASCPAPSAHSSTATSAAPIATTATGTTNVASTATTSTAPSPTAAPAPAAVPTNEPEPMWKRIAVSAGGAALGTIVGNIGMSAASGLMGGNSSSKSSSHTQSPAPPSALTSVPSSGHGYPGPYQSSYQAQGPYPVPGQGSYAAQSYYQNQAPPLQSGQNYNPSSDPLHGQRGSGDYYSSPTGNIAIPPAENPSEPPPDATKGSLPRDPATSISQSDPGLGGVAALAAPVTDSATSGNPLISPQESFSYQQLPPSQIPIVPDGSIPPTISQGEFGVSAMPLSPTGAVANTFSSPREVPGYQQVPPTPMNYWPGAQMQPSIQEQYMISQKYMQTQANKKEGDCCTIM